MGKPDYRDIRVRGGQHHRYHEAFEKGFLQPRTELILRREPDNQYDPHAVAAFVKAGEEEWQVGHVAAHQVGQLYWRLDRGAVVMRCTVMALDLKKHSLDAYLVLNGGWKAPNKPKLLPSEVHPDDADDIPF